jgi:hypothetical protein
MPRRNDRAQQSRIRRTRRHTWPTCPATGKVRLGEAKDVRLALRTAAWARAATTNGVGTSRREVRGYSCPACNGYHLTSWGSAHTPARYTPPVGRALVA